MEKLLKYFENLSGKNRLAHAYIFFGEDKTKIGGFVRKLAQGLENGFGGQKEVPLSDVRFFDASGRTLGIDEARELKGFLAMKAASGKHRIVIIEGADNLTPQAQNALLKISEDPPENALIIVSLTREENLLPTVLSRFQRFYIGGSGRKEADHEMSALARKFLRAPKRERSEIIKKVTGKDDDEAEDLTLPFIDCLIAELSNNTEKNWRMLKALSERRRLLGMFSLSRRLQLEFLNSLWYN